jgi:hypothetical protein
MEPTHAALRCHVSISLFYPQVLVRYMPQALGTHNGSLVVQATSEHGNTVAQTLTLQVSWHLKPQA